MALQIFRAGRHLAMGGQELEFSEATLAAIAAAYDPAVHEAPLVVGHPTLDAPAYGWVKSLAASGALLHAEHRDVDPEFSEAVASGRYKYLSASFYTPGSKSNPKPEGYYLRHVGFLGATPPAVKGLKPAEFGEGDDDDDIVTVEFGDWNDVTIARAFRSLRDWFIGKFGIDEADKALPPWSVDSVQEDAAATLTPPAAFTEPTPPPEPARSTELDERARVLEQRTRELEERTSSLDAQAADLRRDKLASTTRDFRAFCERLIRGGRPLPCSVDLAVSFAAHLSGDESVSFGERSPLEVFRDEILAKLPRRVEFGERVTQDDGADEEGAVDFADRIRERVSEARKQGRFLSTEQAAAELRRVDGANR